jgi:hypothetical protein
MESEVVDQIGIVPNGGTGARNMTSLDYDPNGNAVISYASFEEVRIAVKAGTAWAIEVVVPEPQTGSVIGGLTDLRVETNGTAHIAFYEFPESLLGGGGISTGTVKYAGGLASNRAPILTGVVPGGIVEGSAIDFTLEVSDPEQDNVTLTAEGLPEGAQLDGTTIIWTPGFSQAGTYQITIVASDGQTEASETFEFVVGNVNAPVRISSSTPTATTVIVATGGSQTFEITSSDEDGDAPTISWSLNGQVLDSETGTTVSVIATDAAQDLLSVTVSDGETSATRSWTVARSLQGDFDGSGTVDFSDFLSFAAGFGQSVASGADPTLDLDGSGVIDFADFLTFAHHSSASVSSPPSPAGFLPSFRAAYP